MKKHLHYGEFSVIIIVAIVIGIADKIKRRCRPWQNVISAIRKLLSELRFPTLIDAPTEPGSRMLRR